VIGFLPYWLISKASIDYSKYITNLTYFSLSVDENGNIEQYTNPGESEPGYHTLVSGKADAFLSQAKEQDLTLSLAVFSGDDEIIAAMLENPQTSAQNLLNDVTPLMTEYGFSELNLDIEYVSDASPAARLKYTEFIQAVRNKLDANIIKTLSTDLSASAFVKDTNLADPVALTPLFDKIIIMAYDYHYRNSYVTGPVAPGEGAGLVSEFDTRAAIEAALVTVPRSKIILGIPLYGYEWDTIGSTPRSAVIASTGLTISNARAEELLTSCASCSAEFDPTDKESHIIYLDQKTGTYHQIFYPDQQATQYKVDLAKDYSLAGMALWALGYEGTSILKPLASYHN